MISGLTVTGAYLIHFKIGFSPMVIGITALVLALAGFVLHLGASQDSGRRLTPFAAASGLLVLIGLAGLFGLVPGAAAGTPDAWFLSISPEGFGAVGILISFAVSIVVTLATPAPPAEVQAMVEEIRLPSAN
ncbi:MAG: hypothetical protein C0461_14325 [Brevundimonas sp.]|nr:hypothetical protein [Brevundimonas sp.]